MFSINDMKHMFSEILDSDIIHEMKDRARMLDIDCGFDYSIDLRGTQWEEKGVYQVEKITEGNKLLFQVDLYFFCYTKKTYTT